MAGERSFTSIKALLEGVAITLAPIGGTITIDEITNTVTVQLVEPVTIDGTISTTTTITNNPLKIDDVQTSLTITQSQSTLSSSSITILAANANRKYVLIRNTSASDATAYIHFEASIATPGTSLPIRKGEYFEFPEGFIYTGEIRALSSGFGNDSVSVLEGT